jgi:hypothetical protein
MPSSGNAGDSAHETSGGLESYTSKFNRIVSSARAALVWERVWPRIVPPLAVTGLFASASWLGAWQHIPQGTPRLVGFLASLALLGVSPFLVNAKSPLVSRDEAISRIDKITGTLRGEAGRFADRAAGSDPGDADIYNRLKEKIWEKWGDKFHAGIPHPDMHKHDPFKLRFAVALLTAVAATVGAVNHNLEAGLRAAFNWEAPATPPAPLPKIEVKAWTTLPDGINDPPPLYITQDVKDDTQGGDKLVAHKNSRLTVITFEEDAAVSVNGQDVPAKALGDKNNAQAKQTFEHNLILPEGPVVLDVHKGKAHLDWHITVLPDEGPSASITGVKPNDKDPQTLDLDYKRKDDYGVKDQTIKINPVAKPDPGARPLSSAKLPDIKAP